MCQVCTSKKILCKIPLTSLLSAKLFPLSPRFLKFSSILLLSAHSIQSYYISTSSKHSLPSTTMTRPQTRSQTRSGTRNPRNPLAPQLAGIATTRGRGRGRGRARTAHLMNHTPLVIPSPSPLGPAPSSSNDSATGLGDFREFFCDPDDGTISTSLPLPLFPIQAPPFFHIP